MAVEKLPKAWPSERKAEALLTGLAKRDVAAAPQNQGLNAIETEHARSPGLPVGLAARLPRNLGTRRKANVSASFHEKQALDYVVIHLVCVVIHLVHVAIQLVFDAILLGSPRDPSGLRRDPSGLRRDRRCFTTRSIWITMRSIWFATRSIWFTTSANAVFAPPLRKDRGARYSVKSVSGLARSISGIHALTSRVRAASGWRRCRVPRRCAGRAFP